VKETVRVLGVDEVGTFRSFLIAHLDFGTSGVAKSDFIDFDHLAVAHEGHRVSGLHDQDAIGLVGGWRRFTIPSEKKSADERKKDQLSHDRLS
jgi:hypothetical protein